MKLFPTEKKENLDTKWKRFIFNIFPSYRRTGGRVKFISADMHEIHVQLGLRWTTRNYVGSVFGGSMFGALDPIYMIQFIQILGKNYVVWDKSGEIKFLRPIKKQVSARFLVMPELIEYIKHKVASDNEMEIDMTACFEDKDGVKYAEMTKRLYIADKEYYKSKRKK